MLTLSPIHVIRPDDVDKGNARIVEDDSFDGPLTLETARYDEDPTGGSPSRY